MTKLVPAWYGQPWGTVDQAAWDQAVDDALDVLHHWGSQGTYETYGEFIQHIPSLDWPDGPWVGHGRQVGDLLGNVCVHEWLADQPLLSALVVRAEDGGKGRPSLGFFKLCQRLGLISNPNDEVQQLAVWDSQVKACFAGAAMTYPTNSPNWS